MASADDLLDADRLRQRDSDVPPSDLGTSRKAWKAENRKAWAEAQQGTSAIEPAALARARASCRSRKAMRDAVRTTVLAVLDDESGMDARTKLDAAKLGATITGLAKVVAVQVNNTVVSAFGAMSRVQGE